MPSIIAAAMASAASGPLPKRMLGFLGLSGMLCPTHKTEDFP